MTSRTRLNLLLAFSLVGLISLAVFEPGKDEMPIATSSLTNLIPKAVQKIQLHSPGQADIQLEKIGGHWQMQKPFVSAANQQRLDQLLKIVSAKSLASYPVNKMDLQQLKLANPSLTLVLNNIHLEFGGTAALGGSRYVRIDNTVHLITDRYSHLANGSVTNLLSPALLNTTDKITALQLSGFKLSLHDGRWQFNDSTLTTNPDRLQQFLDEWRHARAFAVQPIDPSLNNTDSEMITVSTAHSALNFILLRTDDEIIFQRRDLGLQYHFSPETGQRLLTLPQHSPQINDA